MLRDFDAKHKANLREWDLNYLFVHHQQAIVNGGFSSTLILFLSLSFDGLMKGDGVWELLVVEW